MTDSFPIKFGDAGQYELSESAFRHILWGDTSIRLLRRPNPRATETVLSGGLHTWQGWQKFVDLHPKVVHLLQFRVDLHDDWYYARELMNGAITLKIPRCLYTNAAANITMQPDLYYKSGYLWKTLYPASYNQEAILEVIKEALLNIDQEDSKLPTAARPLGVVFGYANVFDPFRAIKLRIQLEGNQIKSAFPAWGQPSTGNNGKPYSHAHSISFQIAESTIEYERNRVMYGPVFMNNRFNLESFMDQTPAFVRSRPRRDMSETANTWQTKRMNDLAQVAIATNSDELQLIESYLDDYVCAKDPFMVQRELYANCPHLIDASPEFYNAAQLTENVGECLQVLALCDRRENTRRAIDSSIRFLRMAVVHAGGLNTLMFKRLLGRMMTIAIEHKNEDALRDFLGALSKSPCRAALYIEFDLNPFVKTNDQRGLSIIGISSIELELKLDHLLEFIAFNLGENYLIHFSKDDRLAMAKKIVDTQGIDRMATDVMALFVGSDFNFFIPDKLDFQEFNAQHTLIEGDLLAIAKDYSRMLVMLRQRIVLEDPSAYKTEPDFGRWGTQEFFELSKQKHKRSYVLALHEAALRNLIAYADSMGYDQLKRNCDQMLLNLHTERIPLPKAIPEYINSWQTTFDSQHYDKEEIATLIFGRE